MKITIIGGGAGGLFAALLLARAGHEVVVLEQDRVEPGADVESAAGSAYRPTGPRNTLRRLVVDGRPVVTGLQGIGDSVCTTNPTFGRGLSLAMWGAADLVDVIGKHDDRAEQTIAMDERTAEHVAPYYEEQAAVDSARLATLRHAILGDPPRRHHHSTRTGSASRSCG